MTENEKMFRKQWRWMAKHPERAIRYVDNKVGPDVSKHEFFADKGISIPLHACYACEEAWPKCSQCPVDWGFRNCLSAKSPYEKWKASKNDKEYSKWAAVIAKLPWGKTKKKRKVT